MKHIIEGLVEVIGLLPLALILHLLKIQANSNFLPAIVMIFIVYIVIAIVVIKEKFMESIKNRRAVVGKAVGWFVAIFIISFVFNSPLFSKSEVIPEAVIWLIIVAIGNSIGYLRRKFQISLSQPFFMLKLC